jgi:general secretion pathway protein D
MSFSWQGPAQAKVGDKITITLSAQSGEPVRNLGLTLSFDASALKAVDAVEGGFLKQGGSGGSFTRDIDQSGGRITLDAATGEQGAKGGGSVAAFSFEVIAAAADSQISVSSATPAGVSGDPVNFNAPAAHSITLHQ